MSKIEILKTDFRKAVTQLDKALKINDPNDVYKAGCIQYFEFCFELSWKLFQQVLFGEGIECNSPKSCIKSAYKVTLINNEESWLDMLHDRNIMSHTYDSSEALEVFWQLNRYLIEFQNLLISLDSRE